MTNDEKRLRVQRRLDALCAAGASPGLQYTTVLDGAVTTYTAGFADLAARRPLTPETCLMAYSMSKTITAAAVLKLAAEGTLGLDDRADRYLDVPYGAGVTVRRLLSHTAGVRNPIPLRWVHLPAEHAAFDERAALRSVVARNATLAAAPGTRFLYSNLGYWLLGALVEACTGRPFAEHVERELLAPLGLSPATLGYSRAPMAAVATGYLERWSWLSLIRPLVLDAAFVGRPTGAWLEIRAHYVDGPAFGGLIGTTAALGTWLGDLLGPARVLPATARAWLFEPQALASGAPVPMTLGWHIGERNRERYYYKEGGGGGFHSMMRLYPDRGTASVVIGNATGFRAGRALDELDGLAA
ncbi:MAG TPA: serine hydrolase domain-containing protein [Gammaproteobacteria bacterium]|jgi:CubicO group peptidase (beta-lactamase class C family)|nr:serine hydrolase domain-containing protein [Gammaproteobacteria bacterium]